MSKKTRQQKRHTRSSRSHSSSGEEECDDSGNVSTVLKKLEKQMKQQRELITKLTESYDFMSDGFDKLTNEVTKLGKDNIQIKKQVKKLESNGDNLAKRVQQLECHTTKAKQSDNGNHMIITNLPQVADASTLKSIITQIGEQVEHQIKEEDIIEVYQSENKQQKRHKSYPVIVKMAKPDLKRKCMLFRKNGKTIDVKAILPNVQQSNANINFHHLIEKEYAELLKKAKECAKKKKYKFVWFANSTVLVRKEEQSTIIQIKGESDLKKIV